jgi:prophage DNA circulation protein
MLVSAVNTNNKFLASAPNTDFKNSQDTERYKSFLDTIFEGLTTGIDAITGFLKDIIMAVFEKLKQWFGNISNININNIFDMILGLIDSIIGFGGNLFSRAGLTNAMSNACSGFDKGMFNKHGGDNFMLTIMTLASLLAALLCMGINLALTAIGTIFKAIGYGINGIVNVVGGALDLLVFNPIKSVTNGILNTSFVSPDRVAANPNFNVGGLLDEITGNNELTSVFRNTPTATKLLSGYAAPMTMGSPADVNISANKFETYADALKPNWDVKDFTSSLNPARNVLANSRSNIISNTDNILGSVSNIGKKDFLRLI